VTPEQQSAWVTVISAGVALGGFYVSLLVVAYVSVRDFIGWAGQRLDARVYRRRIARMARHDA